MGRTALLAVVATAATHVSPVLLLAGLVVLLHRRHPAPRRTRRATVRP